MAPGFARGAAPGAKHRPRQEDDRRGGGSEPLLLLHGLTGSARVWEEVKPLLSGHFDVMAPTLMGHRGGPTWHGGDAPVSRITDAVEDVVEGSGRERVHVAGNSLGGWVAIELARRGRAKTVCALAPAGCWRVGSAAHRHATGGIRRARRMLPIVRPVLPLLARLAPARRSILGDVAERADRLSADEVVATADDLLGCEVLPAVLDGGEVVEPLDPLPCPVTVAWSGEDKNVPAALNGETARQRLPGACFITLDGVGHVPMFDDPGLVAATIREAAGAG